MAAKRKTVTLYCGSFNPIHVGHMALAKFIVDNNIADELWFVVSPHNPLKSKDSLWNDKFRLRLVRDAVEGLDRVRVSDVEFSLPQPNYTVNTLEVLSRSHPDIEFSLLIGADNLAVFDKWYRFDDIISRYMIYVYPREGVMPDLAKFPQISMIDAPMYNISSTEIREKIRRGEPIRGMVPDAVVETIENML